ncbi:MAG: methylmalonyl-CoA epimerase [Planctomycetota bacterium]|nr:methylmalonyl-CoA epimerase [Planctomycetota bacterium]
MPNILGIDHIAIVVEDLDKATQKWAEQFGLTVGARETVEAQGVEVQLLHAGETRIELLCPLGPDSPVANFLSKKGPGLHHLALAVSDANQAARDVTAVGGTMLHEGAQPGLHGTQVAFVHPKSADGVLLEWVEGGAGFPRKTSS